MMSSCRNNCCVLNTESSSSDDDSEEETETAARWMDELMAKKQHPERLHEELWFNEEGEVKI